MQKTATQHTRGENYIGKKVEVFVDRALGSRHPKYPDMIYAVNYGYIPGTLSPDGEELDAYILGVAEPLETFTGICIAVLKRTKDDDDKLIVVPEGMSFNEAQIRQMVDFQEKFFESVIIFK